MCGRFILKTSLVRLQGAFGFAERPNLQARYNIAPGQAVPVVRMSANGQGRELAMLSWGLIPFWSKETKIAHKCVNARAESLATAPSFREAFRRRRCLIPADGFYEWRKVDGRAAKQPMLIRRRDGEPFGLAGLWEHWRGPEQAIESCTIITTTANELTAPIHHRMPVILDAADHERWLDPSRRDGGELLRPCPAEWLEAVPVSPRVNSVRDEGPELLEAALPAENAATRAWPGKNPDRQETLFADRE
jgi:putative SOS response-associated peptidase YedK